MGTAREDDVKDDRARPGRGAGMTTRELLEEAQALAVQIERLLTSPGCQTTDSDTLRIRLGARAHAEPARSALRAARARQRAARPGRACAARRRR